MICLMLSKVSPYVVKFIDGRNSLIGFECCRLDCEIWKSPLATWKSSFSPKSVKTKHSAEKSLSVAVGNQSHITFIELINDFKLWMSHRSVLVYSRCKTNSNFKFYLILLSWIYHITLHCFAFSCFFYEGIMLINAPSTCSLLPKANEKFLLSSRDIATTLYSNYIHAHSPLFGATCAIQKFLQFLSCFFWPGINGWH